MDHYTHEGRGHLTLRRLSIGPATITQIRAAVGVAVNESRRREHWYVMQTMTSDGLVEVIGPEYVITDAGRDMLHDLDAGPCKPTVRIFRQAERVSA